MKPVILHRLATDELRKAVRYLERQRRGLGLALLNQVQVAKDL